MTHEEFLAAVAEVKAAEREVKAAMRKIGEHYKMFFITSQRQADITTLMGKYYHEAEMFIRLEMRD